MVRHASRAETTAPTLPPSLCDLRQAGYNLIATNDRLPPKEMTVSDTVNDEPITCASCEYRYPRSEAICMMCGTAASAIEPLQPLSSVSDEFSGADYQSCPSSSDSQQSLPHPRRRKLIPVVVVLIGLMAVTSFFYEVRKWNLPKESAPASELTAHQSKSSQKTLVNDTSSTIQSAELVTSSQESREPPRQPTQQTKPILSSCGRRSNEEA
jgi:hypothetical protein